MKPKRCFTQTVRLWGILLLLALGVLIVALDVNSSYRHARDMAAQMREDYVAGQRRLIKSEVERVVSLIDTESRRIVGQSQTQLKQRVDEAYAIVEGIYEQYRTTKSSDELRRIIIEVIRPIRFDDGNGYYFINDMAGNVQLFADHPEFEGRNVADVKDTQGKFVIRDMIDLVRKKEQGFYSYRWTKPGVPGKDHLKVAFVRYFEPFDWFIGSGVYLDAIETMMQQMVAGYIGSHRFGANEQGYVFILDLLDINGGKDFAVMYANPNRPDLVGKHISDDLQDAEGKLFRREFLKGLRERGECYVDYWYKKFDNPEPSPKVSFFKLTSDRRFIVAAGVYLDDVEDQIQALQAKRNARIREDVSALFAAVTLILLLFVVLVNWLSSRVRKDFQLFAVFFDHAAGSATKIDRSQIGFYELDRMAESANCMIDEKNLVEKALRDEHEQLLVTLHSIVDGVITVDVHGRVRLMNRVAETLTGWNRQQAVGKSIETVLNVEYTSESKAPRLSEADDQDTDGKTFVVNNGILYSQNGRHYRIAASSAPIMTTDRELLGWVIVIRDETERLKTEEELLKAKKLESVGHLAGGIAHDFNNILAGVFGNIELAKRKIAADHAAARYLDTAHQSLERATALTKQLLTFAKGGDPLIEAVGVRQVIDQVVQFNLSGSQVKAVIDLPDDLWPLKADKGQFGQVIANLTINAKHAMPMGGTLSVRAENLPYVRGQAAKTITQDCIKIQIKDDGVGMSPDILEKIFDPYFSTKQTGSGLGLATVRSIVEKHQGVISVSSNPGEGTIFTLLMPAEKNRSLAHETAESNNIVLPRSSGRILLIEDDTNVVEVMKDMLQLLGYQVDVAVEGEAGLGLYRCAAASGKPYLLVITDLTIPGGMGGVEAGRRILAYDPQARLIAASGYSTDPVMSQYEKYGFSGRILKPFQLDDVKKELARVMAV